MKKQRGTSTTHKPSVRIKNTTAGITLIALVITIIVLLILAGVSISLVVGENGVLSQASTSVVKTREAEAKEEVSVAWASMETDYLGEWTKNISLVKDKAYIKGKLDEYLASTGEIVGDLVYDEANKTYTLTYKPDGDNVSYEMTISANGKVTVVGEGTSSGTETPGEPSVEEPISLSEITAANYGDYVNYGVDLGITANLEGESTTPKTDWRIFYKDTEQDRVYLIASHYVPNKCSLLKASVAGMTANGDYSLYWDTEPSTLSTIARQDSIFGITSSSYILNSEYASSKCVSMLLDTDHWSNFVDTSVADFAIGGPTIEMYTNSWNAKGYGTLTPEIRELRDKSTGYRVNGSDELNTSSYVGYGDNLYNPVISKGVGSENCGRYWLAAPSGFDTLDSYMIAVCSGGNLIFFNMNYDGETGIRPIVALKPGISGTKDANGIWQLEEQN